MRPERPRNWPIDLETELHSDSPFFLIGLSAMSNKKVGAFLESIFGVDVVEPASFVCSRLLGKRYYFSIIKPFLKTNAP